MKKVLNVSVGRQKRFVGECDKDRTRGGQINSKASVLEHGDMSLSLQQ